MRTRLLLASAAVLVGCHSRSRTDVVPTGAGSPPASGTDVLRLMHDRYDGHWYGTLTFTQATEIRLRGDSVVHQTWYEAAKLPGFLRIDRLAKDGRNVIIFRGDSTYVRSEGGPFAAHNHRNELMTLGFDVYRQPVERSATILREEGYDLATLGEATWRGRPVWVVGAATGDTAGRPARRQFWVDKARLVYVRSLGPGLRDSTQTADIVFDAYEPLAGGWIAKEVIVSEGGTVLQREVYSDVKANVPLGDELFDPAQIARADAR